MLDIKFIRENKDIIQTGAQKKRIVFNVGDLIIVDDKRRTLLSSIEKKRAEQNVFSEKIPKVADQAERDRLIAGMKEVKETLQKEEEDLKEVMKKWQGLMLQVPNIPDVSVPDGDSDADNKEIKIWGEKPKFSFNPKTHVELMEKLDMADFERGAKVAGFRGYFLKNDGMLISFALWQFVLDYFIKKGGFEMLMAPSLVRRETLFGTGYLPQGEEDLYKTQDGDFLAGTAEVAAMSYCAGDVLSVADLPKKIFAFSPCFRREAGSHGKDTGGVMRVHEFFKFEQVVLCEANHEESVKQHEWLNRNMEEVVEALGLPYRVVVNASGDLGLGQVKKYDVELWIPSEGKYREISSASYFHDFQSRRLNIRYKSADGKLRFVHSLNSTALPTPRLIISLIENNQQEDGSVRIPTALQKYLGKEIIKNRK